jgi:hypothetical protein
MKHVSQRFSITFLRFQLAQEKSANDAWAKLNMAYSFHITCAKTIPGL